MIRIDRAVHETQGREWAALVAQPIGAHHTRCQAMMLQECLMFTACIRSGNALGFSSLIFDVSPCSPSYYVPAIHDFSMNEVSNLPIHR